MAAHSERMIADSRALAADPGPLHPFLLERPPDRAAVAGFQRPIPSLLVEHTGFFPKTGSNGPDERNRSFGSFPILSEGCRNGSALPMNPEAADDNGLRRARKLGAGGYAGYNRRLI
jgi:hypothetical protein